jgi:hypothetical protein
MRGPVIAHDDGQAGHSFGADDPDFNSLLLADSHDRGYSFLDKVNVADWFVRHFKREAQLQRMRLQIGLQDSAIGRGKRCEQLIF